MNTIDQGRIYYSQFSNYFKFDSHFFDVLNWNIGQLLMFVLPIVFFLLAIRFSGQFVRLVQRVFKSTFRRTSESYYDDETSRFQKSSVRKREQDYYGWKERVERRRTQKLMR